MAKYKASADSIVFGVYRSAGEEFSGPAWEDAHDWPMPKHLTRLDAAAEAEDEAPEIPHKRGSKKQA